MHMSLQGGVVLHAALWRQGLSGSHDNARILSHVQDPSYPVYVDSSVIMGMTGEYDESSKGFGNLTYMVCRPENNFFPDLSKV